MRGLVYSFIAPGNQIDAAGAFAFAQLVFEATPEAERAVEPRYRRLREAFERAEVTLLLL